MDNMNLGDYTSGWIKFGTTTVKAKLTTGEIVNIDIAFLYKIHLRTDSDHKSLPDDWTYIIYNNDLSKYKSPITFGLYAYISNNYEYLVRLSDLLYDYKLLLIYENEEEPNIGLLNAAAEAYSPKYGKTYATNGKIIYSGYCSSLNRTKLISIKNDLNYVDDYGNVILYSTTDFGSLYGCEGHHLVDESKSKFKAGILNVYSPAFYWEVTRPGQSEKVNYGSVSVQTVSYEFPQRVHGSFSAGGSWKFTDGSEGLDMQYTDKGSFVRLPPFESGKSILGTGPSEKKKINVTTNISNCKPSWESALFSVIGDYLGELDKWVSDGGTIYDPRPGKLVVIYRDTVFTATWKNQRLVGDYTRTTITTPTFSDVYGYKSPEFWSWTDTPNTTKPGESRFIEYPDDSYIISASGTPKSRYILLDLNEGDGAVPIGVTCTHDNRVPNLTSISKRCGYALTGYYGNNGVMYLDKNGKSDDVLNPMPNYDYEVVTSLTAQWERKYSISVYKDNEWKPVSYVRIYTGKKKDNLSVPYWDDVWVWEYDKTSYDGFKVYTSSGFKPITVK